MGSPILPSPSCSFHSNHRCHGFAWQAAGEEEGGPEAHTPTKATEKNKCATSTILETPPNRGVTLPQGVIEERQGVRQEVP